MIPRNWSKKVLEQDTSYVITHMSSPGGQEILVEYAEMEAEFARSRYEERATLLRMEFTRLGQVELRAGLSLADAAAQVAAWIPQAYRDLRTTFDASPAAAATWND